MAPLGHQLQLFQVLLRNFELHASDMLRVKPQVSLDFLPVDVVRPSFCCFDIGLLALDGGDEYIVLSSLIPAKRFIFVLFYEVMIGAL